MREDDLPLVAWCLGAFHAAAFFLALVILAHRLLDVATLLEPVGTARGLLLYGGILAASWWCTRQGLAELPWPAAPTPGQVLRVAGGWGGVTGALAVLLAFVVFLAPLGLAALPALIPLAFALGVGLAFGGLVGLVLGALDVALALAARAIVRAVASG